MPQRANFSICIYPFSQLNSRPRNNARLGGNINLTEEVITGVDATGWIYAQHRGESNALPIAVQNVSGN